MQSNRKPFLFVTFRKHIETDVIYAVFNQTFDCENNSIQVFYNDHHEVIEPIQLLKQTRKATIAECNPLIEQLKSIYEVYVDGLAAIVKPVPYLPFK